MVYSTKLLLHHIQHCQEYERRANKAKQHILSLKQKLDGLGAINHGCKGEVSSDILFVENRQGKVM